MIRKFLVQNLSDRPVTVNIEPWADYEIVAPEGRILFEYEEREEPAEIAFAIMENGSICVHIVSDVIRFEGNSGPKIYGTSDNKEWSSLWEE